MTSAVMTSKGQMTIPKAVRDRLRLKPGDRVDFVVESDRKATLFAVTGDVRDLKGIVPKPKKPVSDKDIEAAIARGWAGELDI